jgi:Tol biopolymer transport system component
MRRASIRGAKAAGGGYLGEVLVLAAICLLATPATVGAAFPGQNGRIAFEYQPPGGDTEIHAMDSDGQNQIPLTANGVDDFAPAYSPDGERIAFTREDATGTTGAIFVMDHDGQNPTPLTSGDFFDVHPSFSPDGQRIVFQRSVSSNESEIFVMGANGENPTPLTSDPALDLTPSFSPDGQSIVFVRGTLADLNVFVMGPNGENQTPLTGTPDLDFDPSWSPDGQRIAFQRNESGGDVRNYVMDASGANQTPLRTNPFTDFDPFFSPDGQRIVFGAGVSSGDFHIFVMDADGQNAVPLTSDPGEASGPNWQPLNPPACDLTGEPKQKSVKRVSLIIACANENATLVAEGSGKAPKGAVASKAKRFTIPPVTAQVPENTPTTLTLKIPKKGKKALKEAAKAGKKGRATITGTLTDDLGQSAQDSFAVKFKPKKK